MRCDGDDVKDLQVSEGAIDRGLWPTEAILGLAADRARAITLSCPWCKRRVRLVRARLGVYLRHIPRRDEYHGERSVPESRNHHGAKETLFPGSLVLIPGVSLESDFDEWTCPPRFYRVMAVLPEFTITLEGRRYRFDCLIQIRRGDGPARWLAVEFTRCNGREEQRVDVLRTHAVPVVEVFITRREMNSAQLLHAVLTDPNNRHWQSNPHRDVGHFTAPFNFEPFIARYLDNRKNMHPLESGNTFRLHKPSD